MTSMSVRHTFLQVSDIHIVPEGLLHDTVDTGAILATALDAVDASGYRPEALVLSGDLANWGETESYRRLRAIVEPVAQRWGAPILYLPGNHDRAGNDFNEAFRAELLGQEPSDEPTDQVLELDGLRIIALDTTEAGRHDGVLRDSQLHWLTEQLDEPAPHGTVLALHHPPIPSPSPLVAQLSLERPERLAAAIAGTDVRLVLCGHAHHASAGVLGGVPVWIAPATAYDTDVLATAEVHRGVTGSAVTRVDVFDTTAVATLVPLNGPRHTVYEHDIAPTLARVGPQRTLASGRLRRSAAPPLPVP